MALSVFITGANRGLGFSLSNAFLRKGFTVFSGQRLENESLHNLKKVNSGNLHFVSIDVTDMASIRNAVKQVHSLTPGLDILINNAAICIDEGVALDNLDFGTVAQTLDVNACGPLRVTQQFLPLLCNGVMKRIVNISSEAGSIGDCWRKAMFGYCMSKAALNMQSKILDNCLKPKGFHVLAIHPGWMRTDMGGSDADISPDKAAEGIVKIVTGDQSGYSSLYLTYEGAILNY